MTTTPTPTVDPTLVTAITPELQELVDAARQWYAGYIITDPDYRSSSEKALAEAVRALAPPAPVLPPIPEPGYYLDSNGDVCTVIEDGVRYVGEFVPWRTAYEAYGPFTRLVPATDAYVHYNAVSEVVSCEEIQQAMRLAAATMRDVARNGIAPATDVADAGIVKELTEALRRSQEELCAHWRKNSSGTPPLAWVATLDECENPEYRCADVRSLLARARAEGATGGGR